MKLESQNKAVALVYNEPKYFMNIIIKNHLYIFFIFFQ